MVRHVPKLTGPCPHAIGAHGGPVEILTILDLDGERAHLHGAEDAR
ncbi:hypothetical protein [Streptomyces sp. TP-A0874]|nr:hypothetical protein [Streptomyces sp. TP-A0874]